MPIVLSHRGNLTGPSPSTENAVPTMRAALWSGWSIETDIRRAADGRFYIWHDARREHEGQLADDFGALFRAHPAATISLNIKEPRGEHALIAFLDEQAMLAQTLLPDMELIEPRADKYLVDAGGAP